MFARFLLVTVLLLSVVTGTRQVLAKKHSPQKAAEMLMLTHANVIDRFRAQPLRDATVIVHACSPRYVCSAEVVRYHSMKLGSAHLANFNDLNENFRQLLMC